MFDIRAVCFPYCIRKDENWCITLLNRRYKPIGFNTSEFVEYEDYPIKMKVHPSSWRKLKRRLCVAQETASHDDDIFLYHDGVHPLSSKEKMAIYLKKLDVLMSTDITHHRYM